MHVKWPHKKVTNEVCHFITWLTPLGICAGCFGKQLSQEFPEKHNFYGIINWYHLNSNGKNNSSTQVLEGMTWYNGKPHSPEPSLSMAYGYEILKFNRPAHLAYCQSYCASYGE